MEIHRVSAYHDVEHALRITDLKQSLYDEGKILMDKVLVTLHGDEHRQRRSIESQLFRKNFFRVYENEVFPGLLSETLDQFLTESSLDLKELGYRIMVHLSLSFAGIDRIDGTVEEADTQHRLLIQLGQAATIGQFKGDREPIFQEIREAIDEFLERFFLPSRARRLALLERYREGTLSEEDLPRDILTILLMHDVELSMPDELMVREVEDGKVNGGSRSKDDWKEMRVNSVRRWCNKVKDRYWLASKLEGGRKKNKGKKSGDSGM